MKPFRQGQRMKTLVFVLVCFCLASVGLVGAEESRLKGSQARSDSLGDPLPHQALQRLGTIRFRHKKPVRCIAFLPGRKTIISGSDDCHVSFWEFPTGRRIRDWILERKIVSFAPAPDGRTLVIALEGKDPILKELSTGKGLRDFCGHQEQVTSLAFSPSGLLLVSGSQDRTVRVWLVGTGQQLHKMEGHEAAVTWVGFSPDGKRLISGSRDHTVRLWDVSSGRESYVLRQRASGHNENSAEAEFSPVAISPGGNRVAFCGDADGLICIWDLTKREKLKEFGKKGCRINSLAFSPDGALLATGVVDGALTLWDAATGNEIRKLETNTVLSVAFSPNGKTLASGGADQSIRLWDVATGNEQLSPASHKAEVLSLAFSPDGRTVATLGADQSLRLWDVVTGRQVSEEKMQWERVRTCYSLCFTPDGQNVVFADTCHKISFRAILSKTRVRQFYWPSLVIESFSLSPGGKVLALEVGSVVHLWDVDKDKEISTLADVKNDQEWMQATCGRMGFFPDGKTLAFSRFSSAIQLWDLAGGKGWRQLGNRGDWGSVAGIAISPNGKFLASFAIGRDIRRSRMDAAIRLWEVMTGKPVLVLGHSASSFRSIAYSPDGRGIVSGAKDGTIQFWEASTGKELLSFREEGNAVFSVAVSPDGKAVASAMSDGTVLIWDLSPVGWEGQARALTLKELEQMWSVLAEDNGSRAYLAIWKLAAFPERHIPFLRARIRRVERADLGKIRTLIAKLDHDDFDVREAASQELGQLGAQVEGPLREALAGTASAEARVRIELLLQARTDWTCQHREIVRAVRTVWVLQRMGSPEARAILQDLAKGSPEARVTEEARAALDFLANATLQR